MNRNYEMDNEMTIESADIDRLTGVYSRQAGEAVIRTMIQPGGAMLVCNVDNCRVINNRFGHKAGDECLHDIARLLGFIAGERAVVVRVNGNVFVIYSLGFKDIKEVDELADHIIRRIDSYNLNADIPLALTIGTAFYQNNDTFGSMFTRASRRLDEKMIGKGLTKEIAEPENWAIDMKILNGELAEEMKETGGALCREPETFKMVYRYIVRGMTRNDIVASLAILSITNESGGVADYDVNETMMEILGEALHKTLRFGDLYCRYSNSQYMAIFNGADEINSATVCKRVEASFRELQPKNKPACSLDCRWERIKGE
ncbi:MAG: diguanylate cyclase [Clostridiales bacterium]|nr:diguanylate cyclase [Clostridiales bacterium]MDD7016514.1 diguanylate cyclase [Bacillota bacterium]MDY4960073.1 diguanylate cyclase [Lentihominibacter sp.]